MVYTQLRNISGVLNVSQHGMCYGRPFFLMDIIGPDLFFWRITRDPPISLMDRAVATIGCNMVRISYHR